MMVWKLVYYWAPDTLAVEYLLYFLQYMVMMNVGLAVFNLIPVPPLDGSRVLLVFLPQRVYFGVMRYEKGNSGHPVGSGVVRRPQRPPECGQRLGVGPALRRHRLGGQPGLHRLLSQPGDAGVTGWRR